MSQQLTISSLISALAMVSLCLAVAVHKRAEANSAEPRQIVQAEHNSPGLPI